MVLRQRLLDDQWLRMASAISACTSNTGFTPWLRFCASRWLAAHTGIMRPVRYVRRRAAVALRAAVPVAAIDKHREALLLEREVRLPGQIARVERPALNPCPHEPEPQCRLGRPIAARTYRGHIAGALFGRKNVH